MTFVVIGGIWIGACLLGAIVMVAIGRAGHWEDQQRGYESTVARPSSVRSRPLALVPARAPFRPVRPEVVAHAG
jgi:hypothetical protein